MGGITVISVLTPTIRPEGLEIVNKALKRQTFKDFEWLIGSPFEPGYGTWVKDDFEGGYWTLNRMYNKLIKQCKGDVVVSWQDYTFAKPDTLERFFTHYLSDPKTLVSAVGNKYTEVYPELGEITWKDPRERDDQGSYYYCFFNDIEWNLCLCPKSALYEVGGFDEKLDFLGFGMDGYGVNERLSLIGGYEFALDQAIKSYSLSHGRVENWERDNAIHGAYANRRKEYLVAPRLKYL